MTALLEISDLAVRYVGADRATLHGVNLRLEKGERLAIIGESGSGKSTLARAIAGLLPRQAHVSGKVEWPALPKSPLNGKDIGFVFQDSGASLNPLITIGRQVAEVAETHLGLSRSGALARAARLFAQVQLPQPEKLLKAWPHELSGGQRQRVGIAAAIVAQPVLLIADEPTSALDTIVQAEILRLILALVKETEMALLIVTHDIALAAAIAQRIVVLRDGEIVETGAVSEVIFQPKHDYTRTLLSSCLTLSDLTQDEASFRVRS